MARSGQVFFARCAILGLLALAGCAAPDAPAVLQRNDDGTLGVTPDPGSRERLDRLERRRQDDQIQREIYNWLPPGGRRPSGVGG